MSKIDKGPITRIYKELLQKKKKKGNPVEIQYINKPFTKVETPLANKNMKRCSTLINK